METSHARNKAVASRVKSKDFVEFVQVLCPPAMIPNFVNKFRAFKAESSVLFFVVMYSSESC